MTYEEYVRMVRLVLGHTLPRLEIMTERMAEKPGVVSATKFFAKGSNQSLGLVGSGHAQK